MPEPAGNTSTFSKDAMTIFLQVGAVVLLLYFCLRIVSPFVGIVLWALIIAVSFYPIHLKLAERLGGSQKRSATVIVIAGLLAIVGPVWVFADSGVDSVREIAGNLREGRFTIAPPDPSVKEWPLIGERVHSIWSDASANLEATLQTYEVQLRALGERVLVNLGSSLLGVLAFVVSVIVAGVLLVYGKAGYEMCCAAARSIAGEQGKQIVDVSIATVRSVTKGVLGVAFVQTAFAVLGLIVMDVPAAGLWGAIILIVAIMQLPPWLVLAPIAVWVFSVNDPVPATLFAIYALVVSISDMFLKPMFLGRGVDVPMPVILIGAIGGAITGGVMGLFFGAVVLAVGYELFLRWVYGVAPEVADEFAEVAKDE